jgi:hypothetical protein
MKSFNPQKIYALRADASALGGYLDTPVEKLLPTLAPVSLPPVGGFAMARSEAFTLDGIISCSAAHTRVTGKEQSADGSSAILISAVIEDLNILEVIRADRIVTQLSIHLSAQPGSIGISVAGTSFEGLKLAGHECRPTLNKELQRPRDAQLAGGRLTWEEVRQAGRAQGKTLLGTFKDRGEDAKQWLAGRHRWMTAEPPADGSGYAQASLVDALAVAGDCRSYGHIVEIPDFGRIFIGEIFASRDGVQLIGIRAELGCAVRGRVTSNAVGGGGARDN